MRQDRVGQEQGSGGSTRRPTSTDSSTHVWLAGALPLVGEAIASQLARVEGLSVDGSFGDSDGSPKRPPDVAILDVDEGRLVSLEGASAEWKSQGTRLIALGSRFLTNQLESCVRMGVSGFVTKDLDLKALVEAVRKAAANRAYLCPAVRSVLRIGPSGVEVRPNQRGGTQSLTGREKEVLRAVAEARTNKQVAEHLGISVRTVECHVRNIMIKLNIHARVGLTRLAIREGFSEASEP